jgi:hypothetical protein
VELGGMTESDFGEVALVETADGTNPVLGKIIKSGAGRNIGAGITFCRIIHITANALILVHSVSPF